MRVTLLAAIAFTALSLTGIHSTLADNVARGGLDALPIVIPDTTAHSAVVWDEEEQAWRDASGYVWPNEILDWSVSDGLGHYWPLDRQEWHYRDGSLYVPPPPPAPVYSASAGVEQWRWLVAAYFPSWAVDFALAVLDCESGGDPSVTGFEAEQGLFQLKPFHAWRVDWANMYDPEVNVRAAHSLWLDEGWGPWSCA